MLTQGDQIGCWLVNLTSILCLDMQESLLLTRSLRLFVGCETGLWAGDIQKRI